MNASFPEFQPDVSYLAPLEATASARPIVIIGAGGIVRDAHLPAYRKGGFAVAALVNRTLVRAERLAADFSIDQCFDSVEAAVRIFGNDVVYDLALMPEQYPAALRALPYEATVLIQKPLGNDLAACDELMTICAERSLTAAVNTQLRFAPYVAEARAAIASGEIGELVDLEIRVTVNTPWSLFPHVLELDRLEINMHSVHYIDLVRSFLGDPSGVSAVTERNPGRETKNTRSVLLMRYPDRDVRVVIGTNHDHDFGPDFEESFIKWEGTRGAIRAQMGLLMDYPRGMPDSLLMTTGHGADNHWRPLPFEGSWFPDAFIGSMNTLQRFAAGETSTLPTSVHDVRRTMAVVDAAYESAASSGTAPRY